MQHCAECAAPVEPGLYITHKICGCVTCAVCAPDDGMDMDFNNCKTHAAGKKPARLQAAVGEPRTTDGIDYVLYPGPRPEETGSLLAKVASLIPVRGSKPATALEQTQDPYVLLNNRVPLSVIMSRNRLGLDHMLRVGVTMYDLLKNGYTWNDVVQFEEMKRGPTRARQVLTTGLKTNANLFRLYPEALPFAEVAKHVGMQARHVCELLGLSFPDNGPLECQGDQRWNALDCVNLGLTMNNLMDFGLHYKQQYEDLMLGLTAEEQVEAEKLLKATVAHMDRLVDADAPAPAPAPLQKEQLQKKPARVVIQHPVHEEEQEQEDEEEQDEPSIVAAPVRNSGSVNGSAPFRREAQRVTVAAAAPAVRKTKPASFQRVRSPYERRCDYHGYTPGGVK